MLIIYKRRVLVAPILPVFRTKQWPEGEPRGIKVYTPKKPDVPCKARLVDFMA